MLLLLLLRLLQLLLRTLHFLLIAFYLQLKFCRSKSRHGDRCIAIAY